jgi:mRNA interferase MazF
MYRQGAIIVVLFPFTDGSGSKKRPAMIISNESVNKTGDYLLVQITSKNKIYDLSIPIGKKDCIIELPLVSFVRPHKIFTVYESLILSKIMDSNPEFFKSVADTICSFIKKES